MISDVYFLTCRTSAQREHLPRVAQILPDTLVRVDPSINKHVVGVCQQKDPSRLTIPPLLLCVPA